MDLQAKLGRCLSNLSGQRPRALTFLSSVPQSANTTGALVLLIGASKNTDTSRLTMIKDLTTKE